MRPRRLARRGARVNRGAAALALLLAFPAGAEAAAQEAARAPASYGPRPFYLVDAMADGPLKARLAACFARPASARRFAISHRGAPLMFPEHTRQSYLAAVRMGAGTVECDVTFTSDKALVCRHAQDDLARTTNILATPLAATCKKPFRPAAGGRKASAECRVSDVTLEQFRTLRGRMEGGDRTAGDLAAYLRGAPRWRTELYETGGGRLMTLEEHIALLAPYGVTFMPELKKPVVPMPWEGMTQQDYARALIDAFRAAGVPAARVRPQSFSLDDVLFWLREAPEFGRGAIWLDGRWRDSAFDPARPERLNPSMAALAAMGVRTIAPPMWVLLALENGRIVPSAYARAAKAAGLEIVAWTLERSGPLSGGGGWYHKSIAPAVAGDGQVYEVLDVLARDVGVSGVFSDWPATVAFYAACTGLD